MHSSACGCTRSRSRTKRLSLASRLRVDLGAGLVEHLDAHAVPVSRRLVPAGTAVRGPRRCDAGPRRRGLELVVRRDDAADQPVAYDVVAGEPVERDVLHAVEDLLDDLAARS